MMWGMWQPNVPKMKLRVYQFDRILRYVLPDLHTHFQEIELTPEILVAQWYDDYPIVLIHLRSNHHLRILIIV